MTSTMPYERKTGVAVALRLGCSSMVETFRHRRELDGLRAVAVLAVLFYHADLGVPGGFVGVDVFFVLSGYLITSLIIRDMETGVFSFAQFWERRARRILPASAVLVAATLVAGGILLMPRDYASLGRSALATGLFGANIFFWRSVDYFTTAADELPLLHMWSLAVEEQFYFIVPFLLHACARSRNFGRGRLWAFIGAACLASMGLSAWMTPRMPAAAFYLLPSRAWELGIGALVALWPPFLMPHRQSIRAAAAWLGLAGIGVPCAVYDEATPFPGLAAVPPCLGAALFILSNARLSAESPPLPVRLLSSKPCVAVGLLSYSLYLWHWPLFAFTRYWTVEPLSVVTRVMLCMLAASAAIVSWRFVETPFRTRAMAPRRAVLLGAAAVALAAIVATGFVIDQADGFPARFGPAMLELASDDLRTVAAPSATLDDVRQGRLPILGNPEDPVALLVWGDSHAMAILPAVEALCTERRVSARYAVHSSTAPVLGYEHTDRYSRGSEAPVFAEAMISYIREHRIPRVLLVARWSGYLAEDRVHGAIQERGATPQRTDFADALLETIRAVAASGAQPCVFAEVPSHAVDVPKALRCRLMFGTDTDRLCPARVTHAAHVSEMTRLIPALQKAGAMAIDASELLLSADREHYLMDEGGASLYLDEHHLSDLGSSRIASAIAGCLSPTRSCAPSQPALQASEGASDTHVPMHGQ